MHCWEIDDDVFNPQSFGFFQAGDGWGRLGSLHARGTRGRLIKYQLTSSFNDLFSSNVFLKYILHMPLNNLVIHAFVKVANSDTFENDLRVFKPLKQVLVVRLTEKHEQRTGSVDASMRDIISSVRYTYFSALKTSSANCKIRFASKRASIIMYSMAFAVNRIKIRVQYSERMTCLLCGCIQICAIWIDCGRFHKCDWHLWFHSISHSQWPSRKQRFYTIRWMLYMLRMNIPDKRKRDRVTNHMAITRDVVESKIGWAYEPK